jgi:formylglycine-generating enzyme required for sulfatase activity
LEKVRGEWRCRAQLVGKKRANALGFHDMLGNVGEWCSDWFSATEYAREGVTPASPHGPESGAARVVRGGSWEGPPWDCRASHRDYAAPDERDEATGLRVARDVRTKPRIAVPSVRREAVEPWGEVLEAAPDPRVVTDAELRHAIEQSALPWRVKDKETGVEMLLVPAATYLRGGSPVDPQASANEKPQHSVVLSTPFYLGRYELTQAQWELAMGENPSKKARNPQAPVDSVSFDDTLALRARTGLRVPTEGEWEFACRAGTLGARYGALDDIAWYASNSGLTTHEVGRKLPNALGFHDMIGNVYEWCSDWYSAEEHQRCAAGVRDPVGPESGKHRMLRGGSCHYDPEICRVSRRGTYLPAGRFDDFGLRVARTPGVDLPPARDAKR